MVGSITDSTDMSLIKLWETVKARETWHAVVHGVAKKFDLAAEQQQHKDCRHIVLWPILMILY